MWGPLSQWKRWHWWNSTLFSESPLDKTRWTKACFVSWKSSKAGRGWGLSQISWIFQQGTTWWLQRLYNRQTASYSNPMKPQWNHVEFCYVQSNLQAATNKSIQYGWILHDFSLWLWADGWHFWPLQGGMNMPEAGSSFWQILSHGGCIGSHVMCLFLEYVNTVWLQLPFHSHQSPLTTTSFCGCT